MKRIELNTKKQSEFFSSGILSCKDLYVSGQVGVDSKTGVLAGGVSAQAYTALSNIVAITQAAGGNANSILKLTIYVVDMSALHKEMSELVGYFAKVFCYGHVPTMTLIGVTALISPDYLVEIEGHARIGTSE